MASKASLLPWLLLLVFISPLLISCTSSIPRDEEEKVYIVYMGDLPKGDVSTASLHANLLRQVRGSRASNSLIHSYKKSFNGFVARLSEDEAERLNRMEGVVSVFLNEKKKLMTTRSWDFMGLSQQANRTVVESDVIVGMFDTGVWPESESFDDTGLGPPPAKWKGTCQSSFNFTCNNKIIGARFYYTNGTISDPDYPSPRDSEGHGTHTASIAAGSLAAGASMHGVATGTARGGVPSARIAVYKICWATGCADADILAAFDDAIADCVDVISLSVGGGSSNYFEDSISIGAFHAMRKGILTSNAAGNSGPGAATVASIAPWSLSVAASSIDRRFITKLTLGNNASYEGISVNAFDMEGMYPLIHGADAPNATTGVDGSESRFCYGGSLNSTLVKGKVVVCDAVSEGDAPSAAGAAGTVMLGGLTFTDAPLSFPLPTTLITNHSAASMISKYLKTTRKPTGRISKSTEVKRLHSPRVVSFSSRGPNPITADILKPDLTAPGLDILAAWSEGTTATGYPGDTLVVKYNIKSGTSMSCPHASGIAAYVKSFHPTWSPAAIKSALMTTALPMSSKRNPDAEFAYGSGHLNPTNAVNPGLVYDAGDTDYIKFLCGQGYSTKQLRLVTGDQSSCSKTNNGTVWDLNYPSFALSSPPKTKVTRVFHRTVTNVGTAVSTYRAKVYLTKPGLSISVEPDVLNFKSVGQNLSFAVTVQATMGSAGMLSGALEWNDGVHRVKSPVVAHVIDQKSS